MNKPVTAFTAVNNHPSFPAMEEDVLRFWDDADVYRRSLGRRAEAPAFVFYEAHRPPMACHIQATA